MKNRWKLGVATAALAATLGLAACGGGSPEDVLSADAIKALTVTTVDQGTCVADVDGIVSVYTGALEGVPPRAWTDAISTPLRNQTDANAALREIQWSICHDRFNGATWLVAMANLEVEGVKLSEINEWLKPYAVDANKVNDIADEFLPQRDKDIAAMTADEQKEVKQKSEEWQQLAQKLNTLLNRFQNVGIGAPMSEWNYHLALGGAKVDGLPEVALNDKQENLNSVILVLTEKGNSCPIVAIGGNVLDRRPEGFPTGCNPKGQPNVGMYVPGTPGGNPPQGTGGNPPPTNPPPTNPPPTGGGCPPGTTPPDCTVPKVYGDSSGANGNGGEGAGMGESNPGPVRTQTPVPSAPRVNPAPPASSGGGSGGGSSIPTGSTPDPNPAPAPTTEVDNGDGGAPPGDPGGF